ncbi:MAG: hypothetical protein J1F10_00020 [Muribaculaceae bacterium]|nr:hypothetical protein [Muribaculaceae bacterium]
MRYALTIQGSGVLKLVKAQTAIIAMQNPMENHIFIDVEEDELFHTTLVNGYMNLCGKLLPYIDQLNLNYLEQNTIYFILNTGSSKIPALSFLYCMEQYLAWYILNEIYSTSPSMAIIKHCKENFRTSSHRIMEIMTL